MRGPTGLKFCTMVSTRSNFIMPVQNFGGAPQKYFRGQKHAKFGSTWKFGSEYLRNGWRYSKLDFYFIYRDSSRVRRNKSREVWSSDLGDLDVESYPPKTHFLEERISAPRGCCAPKFLHALENDQVQIAHPPHRGRRPRLQLFSKGSQKLP